MGGFWQFMQIVFIAVSAIGGFVGLYEGRRWSTRNMGPTEPMQFRVMAEKDDMKQYFLKKHASPSCSCCF